MLEFPNARGMCAACNGLVCAIAWLGAVGLRAEDLPPLVKIARFGPAYSVRAVGFSKNADLLACRTYYPRSISDHKFGPFFYLFKIATGQEIPADAPGSYQFVTTPYARVCRWTQTDLRLQDDLTDRTRLTTIRLKQLDVDQQNLEMGDVFFSADDRLVAGMHKRDNKSLSIWDSRSGELVARFAMPGEPNPSPGGGGGPLAFDAKNRYVAIALGIDIRRPLETDVIVWDLTSKQQVFQERQDFRVVQLVFCANGDLVCAGNGPRKPDVPEWFGQIVVKRPGELRADEGKSGTTATFRTIQRMTPLSGVTSIALSRAGLVVGCMYQRVSLWDLATGKELCVLNDGEDGNQNLLSCYVAAGQNGSLIAFTNKDGIDLYRIGADQAKK